MNSVELLSQATDAADPLAEVRRLRRQLMRERARRVAAENIGERATADLYESIRELRAAQTELIERADQSRLVSELGRALRQDLDSTQLTSRAAESVGRATDADRCDVLLVDAEPTHGIRGSWSRTDEAEALPRPDSFVDLPEVLTALLLEAAQGLDTLRIDHVDEDPRLTPEQAAELVAQLGVRALAAVPLAVGDEVIGWMLLQSITPRTWRQSDIAICEGLSHDLVVSLIQVQSFDQQRESVNRLQELDRAKDAFISTVSHELRTPLTSIVGYLELMADGGMGELTPEVGRGIGIIERNVNRLRGLVEDLLALSAYDADQVQLDLRPVDLPDLVQECHTSLIPVFVGRGLRVDIVADPAAGPVLGDREQLQRVVLNVLSNAVKFSRRDGSITVSIRPAVRRDGEPEMVELSVADHGIGIPADELSRIFSRFFRSSLSTADEIQGTGLGLALVRTVVEWHDGHVDVASVEGEGTTITVRLPAAG